MKNFMRFLMIAVAIILVAVMASMFVAPVYAASENIIYISDNGTGDGSSADKPLKAEKRVTLKEDLVLYDDDKNPETPPVAGCKHIADANKENYYCSCFSSTGESFSVNSVLYQAIEKLNNKGGGTIVLVGDVKIGVENTLADARYSNRDFVMPTYGNNKITIKGQGGRLIIEEGSQMCLGGDTVFENLTINYVENPRHTSKDEVTAICAYGYDVVFGDNIVCTTGGVEYTNQTVSSIMKKFVAIAGGRRYGNFTGDVNLTINSGTWYTIYGGNRGNPNNTHWGDIYVNINGGTYLGYVWGDSQESTLHCGNTYYHITGGTFKNQIYAHSATGVGYKNSTTYFKIDGGEFSNSTPFHKYNNMVLDANCIQPYVTFDFSDYTGNTNITTSSFSSTRAPDAVYYPANMVSTVAIKAVPTNALMFVGGSYNADGLVVEVTYNNGKKAEITYSPEDSKFEFFGDNTEAGKSVLVTGTYCRRAISGLNMTVKVVEDPTPTVLGAQISTNNTKGGLRFVAEMSRSAEKDVTIKDYGFYVWDGSVYGANKITDISTVQGIDELTAFGTKFREEYDELGIYNNDKKTMFAAVYDNIQLNDYDKYIYAVAYIEYDYNGQTYTSYSDAISRTVLEVATAAYEDEMKQEADVDKQWIKANILDKYDEYVAASTNLYDLENSERLRDIVVAEMRENAEFAWTPSTDINLTEEVIANNVKYNGGSTYTAGTIYYGLPYVNNAKHELEEFKTYVKTRSDGTNVYYGPIEGINDFGYTGDQATYVESNKYKLNENYYEIESFFPAADYTGMIINVWNKIGTNKVWLTGLTSFIPGRQGTVAVGGYSCAASKTYTDLITKDVGKEGMVAAYKACKRGDVLICNQTAESGSGRSIYMVMEDAGSGNTLKLMTFNPALKNNTHFQSTEKTYDSLFSGGYIPVTLPELATGTQSKTTTFVVGLDGADAIKTGILSGELISNKQIIAVNVKLSRNGNDGEFYNETVYCNKYGDQNMNMVNLSQFDMSKVLPYLVDGKTYTLTVNAEVGNEGMKTIASYSYTEPIVNLSALYSSYYDSFNVDFSNMAQTPIDHMKEQSNIYWTPATTFQYANLEGATGFVPNTKFEKGTIYKGVLYANTRATLADFEASLGSSTTKTVGGKKVTVYTLGEGNSNYNGTTDWNYVVGNHCSASMYHGYQKVSRLHASSRGNPNMKLLGLKDLYYGVSSYTNSVAKLYGAEAMYESYALAKPGDFMYRTAGGGHTRLVQSVNVVRDSNGKIDPDKSYVLMIEQTDTLESESNKLFILLNGYDSTWWEHKYTFKTLATSEPSCIILRPHEFMTNETEKQYVGLTKLATKETLEAPTQYTLGIIESNYPIIAVRLTIKDTDGNVLDKVEKTGLTNVNAYNVGQLFTTSTSATYIGNTTDGYLCTSNYKGKSYTYTLEVELAAGRAVLQTLNVAA